MGKDCQTAGTHAPRVPLLLGAMALLVGLAAYWFLVGAPLDRADPLRMIVGACVIFLLPGLVGGELLGLRGRSSLETIALAFAVSCTLEIALIAVVFCLGVGIDVWVALLLGATALGLLVVTARFMRGRCCTFITGLVTLPHGSNGERVLHVICVLVPLLLGAMAYWWGEDITDVGGEKFIHLTFVRYYAEMPLVLANLGIERNLPPPNMVHLWEFLLAGWSACVRIDPLPLFPHARMVIPVIGLAGMYLLVRLVFLGQRKTTLVFAGVLLLCVGQALLETQGLIWINSQDATRGVFAFLGTAQHADSAADILLALTAAVGLLFLRQPRPIHALLLAGVLTANFLWHAREFLQAALYLGVLGPTALLLPSLRRWALLKRWVAANGIVIGVALLCAMISFRCAPQASHGYDEWALKKTALRYAMQPREFFTLRSLFNYPPHFMLSSTMAPDRLLTQDELDAVASERWHYDRWLLMAAGATILLTLLGRARDRRLALYHLLLWLLAYSWNFSMLVIMALTYSEFFMVTPRILYLFSYLVIAAGTLTGVTAFYRCVERAVGAANSRWVVTLTIVMLALLRFGIHPWLRHDHRSAAVVAAVLNAGCLAVFLLVFWCERPRWNAQPLVRALRRPLPLGLCMLLVGVSLMPGNFRTGRALFRRTLAAVHATDWFGDDNPFGYSRALLAWVRTLPPGHRLATSPLDVAMLSVYSPQYLCVQPVGSVIPGLAERERARAGAHPFYRPAPESGTPTPWQVDHQQAVQWLEQQRADYVLVNRTDYDGPAPAYFRAHPERYELVFENSAGREIVFRVRKPGESPEQERA